MFFDRRYVFDKRISRILTILLMAVILSVNCFRPIIEVDAAPAVVYSDSSDGFVGNTGSVTTSTSYMYVGDNELNVYFRAFLKFSLSGVSGIISSARLYLYVYGVTIGPTGFFVSPLPNPGLGECVVIHINDYGSLDAGDFNAPSIGNDPGVLIGSIQTPNVGYLSIDVTSAMQDDVNNGRAWSAFMVKMTVNTNSDGMKNLWHLHASEQAGTDKDPYVEYVSQLGLTDQNNDVPRSAVANIGDWGQSFTPMMNRLTRIDLALDSVGNINTYHVTVNLRSTWGGTIIGSAATNVPPGVRNDDVGELTSFIFPTPIRLIPGNQYIIEVNLGLYYHQSGTNDMISWYCASGDTYPNGRAIQGGSLRNDDMIFRTIGGTASDFMLSASPTSLTIPAGTLRTSTVTVSSISGFSSPVALSYSWLGAIPSGVTVTLPGPVMPPPDGSTTSELQVFASSTATIGTFTLRVTGTSGTLSSNIDVSIQILRATPTPGCVIATATYNSTLASEVIYMRHVRDDLIGSNQVGRHIVNGLNAFYYLWSPPIASFIATHRTVQPVFQILLLPLLVITHVTEAIYTAVAILNVSFASVAAFIFAAASTATIYILIPIVKFRKIYRKIMGRYIKSK
ncbi:MAG: CFI-box-CTERM domain-containing protein [Candidatus Bathyarchaeia archaeon]